MMYSTGEMMIFFLKKSGNARLRINHSSDTVIP